MPPHGPQKSTGQRTHQCQLFTLVASARSSTIQRGSPSPHFAIPAVSVVQVHSTGSELQRCEG